MKRKVALRGGPLDGQLHEIDVRQDVAYIVHQARSMDELARLGFTSAGGTLPILLLVYKQAGRNARIWQFLGCSAST